MMNYELTNATAMWLSGGALVTFALLFFMRRKANVQPEYDYGGLDENERVYINERLEDRIEEDVSDHAELVKVAKWKNKELYLSSRVLLAASAVITAWYWFSIGNDWPSSIVFGVLFGIGNYFLLPFAFSKMANGSIGERMIGALLAPVIIVASLMASSGLASMSTSATRSSSDTAKKDKVRIEAQINTKQNALLEIDQSKTMGALKAEKSAIESQRAGLFLTQVSYTRSAQRRNKSRRGVFDTLDRLSGHCTSPGPVKGAGRLCGEIRSFGVDIGKVKRKIAALGTAAKIKTQIASLVARRDGQASKITSDPLAPVRSVLPEFMAIGLVSVWAVLTSVAGELIIDGLSLMVEMDASKRAKKEHKRLCQKTFRKLKQEAIARYNPEKSTSAVPDVKLNKQLEERFDAKLAEMAEQAKVEELRREEELATVVARQEQEAAHMKEEAEVLEQKRKEEHAAVIEASQDDIKRLKLAEKQLKRVITATSDSVRGKLQPIMEYMKEQVIDIDGGAVPLTDMATDYEQWARLHDRPELKGELVKLLPQTGLENYRVGEMIYFSNIALRSAPQIRAVS